MIDRGRCAGVAYRDGDSIAECRASAVLLATGGAGQVFRDTTNPEVATGDGIAMAYRAGARIADLEFVQFHPTALDVVGAPRFLLSEALRGEGARLVNHADEAFMPRYETAGDLAPRDRVSRAILRERERTGQPVYLSMRHLPAEEVHERFPFISETCRGVGLDLARDRIPVSPAAHYVMGGVETDVDGRTSIPGLFAAGEVACTGVHGANRLASNSLLEGLVFGLRAGRVMPRYAARAEAWDPTFTSELAVSGNNCRDSKEPAPELASVRDLMWRLVGVFRDGPGLTEAVRQLDGAWCWLRAQPAASTPEQVKLASVITVGRLMARAALRREESRGGHFRADFPARDDARWLRHVAETI
jgi:L-aspartate oxidase